MKRVRGFRWRVERVRELYPKRGLGLWFERGSTGTTYREPGTNQHLSVTLVVGVFTFEARASWKALEAGEVHVYEDMVREQEAYNRRRDEEDARRNQENWS